MITLISTRYLVVREYKAKLTAAFFGRHRAEPRGLGPMSLAGASSLLSQHVGGIYYINLDRRPKRRHALEEQFGRSRLLSALGRPRRVVGIDGRTLPLRELVENGTLTGRALERDADGTNGQTTLGDERLTRGAAGLALTYLQLWRRIAHERLPVLVFEDDAQLHPQFDARLAELRFSPATPDTDRSKLALS